MSRADKKADTRARLLDSARAVFEEKGFHAATVEEIADRAGYTRGAFYANWPDKAELLWELAEADAEAQFRGLEPSLRAASMDQKMEAFQAWFDALLRPRPLQTAVNELMTSLGDSDEGRARQADSFARERAAIVPVLVHMEEALGVRLPIPLEHFAAIGFAIGQGLFMQHTADPGTIPSTLFGDAQAYLWFGVSAALQSPEFSPRSGTRPEAP